MLLNYDEHIKHASNCLLNCGLILYPTDTVWGIGCDATNELAVSKVFKVKNRDESKSLVVLVDSLERLLKVVENIPPKALEILNKSVEPTTIIYNNPKGLAKNVISRNNTVAIRIVQDDFCQSLIKEFDKPIVSTSANISEDLTPKSFKEIDKFILDKVDYVVNLRLDELTDAPSRILKILENGDIVIIRE